MWSKIIHFTATYMWQKEAFMKAMEIAAPILESSDSIELWNEYSGDMPCKMHYVGDGAWCDDDGDNWDFD